MDGYHWHRIVYFGEHFKPNTHYVCLAGSEQFLNGTSAQCRLFSAMPLKVEERYDIQSKCIKENKWATMQEKSLYETVQMNISQKERISSKLTLSNNSLRVVTEKYVCLRRRAASRHCCISDGSHSSDLESRTSHQKSDSVHQCAFTWGTILLNFDPIRYKMTDP